MIELRYLERKACTCDGVNTGCSNCGRTERVLQYRQKIIICRPHKPAHYEWSDWQDVPTVGGEGVG